MKNNIFESGSKFSGAVGEIKNEWEKEYPKNSPDYHFTPPFILLGFNDPYKPHEHGAHMGNMDYMFKSEGEVLDAPNAVIRVEHPLTRRHAVNVFPTIKENFAFTDFVGATPKVSNALEGIKQQVIENLPRYEEYFGQPLSLDDFQISISRLINGTHITLTENPNDDQHIMVDVRGQNFSQSYSSDNLAYDAYLNTPQHHPEVVRKVLAYHAKIRDLGLLDPAVAYSFEMGHSDKLPMLGNDQKLFTYEVKEFAERITRTLTRPPHGWYGLQGIGRGRIFGATQTPLRLRHVIAPNADTAAHSVMPRDLEGTDGILWSPSAPFKEHFARSVNATIKEFEDQIKAFIPYTGYNDTNTDSAMDHSLFGPTQTALRNGGLALLGQEAAPDSLLPQVNTQRLYISRQVVQIMFDGKNVYVDQPSYDYDAF